MGCRDASFGVLLLLQTSIVFSLREVHERRVAFGHDFHLIAALPLMLVLKHFRLHQLLLDRLDVAVHDGAIAPAAVLHPQTLEER